MSTKLKIPDLIQSKFNKIQFKLDDPVIFTWLGMKKYGYVINTKKVAWGIQYTVQDVDAKYPCGIQIKSNKTAYTTGCILYDDTRSIGEIELKRRIQTNNNRTITAVSTDTKRPVAQSRDNNISSGRVSKTNNREPESGYDVTTKVGVKSSIARVHNGNSKKRKNIELDTAIQRQRDFLSGFVKKD